MVETRATSESMARRYCSAMARHAAAASVSVPPFVSMSAAVSSARLCSYPDANSTVTLPAEGAEGRGGMWLTSTFTVLVGFGMMWTCDPLRYHVWWPHTVAALSPLPAVSTSTGETSL